jgi:hypothetical protein
VSGHGHAPAAVYPRKRTPPPVAIGEEAVLTSDVIWTQRLEEIIFASVGDQTPVVQSVVRDYTDWATPTLFKDGTGR